MPRPGLEERLAAIQNFNQLKAMLRDDLGWPVQDMSIDDLTFEYEPEELGLKKEDAAKVEEIRQLRSIDGEPFGIFFIRFQRKHMPVTVMRRLLQQLSVRKRKSANPSDRQVWERHDLLFVSQWGEDARRHLSFVHFRDPDEEEQLPSIRVLGWDADDTDLKMGAVARQLEQNLAWRRPGEDEEVWRQRWSKAFHRRHREVIESSKTLSRELAGFARRTRSNILSLLKAETDRGPLRTLMRTFRDALIHDLDEDGFADMYAQTVAYGMLAAWLTGRSGGGTHVPVTTPFLRDLLTSFMHGGEEGGVRIDFDELGLDDIEGLFADSNREAILEDFGDRKPDEDPVIHFYEDFLHEYDASQKKSRGVFYTPRPVVSFIVRSVDEMLRAEFGLEDGLADTATWAEMAERIDDLEIPDGVDPSQGFVRILDPATGTGTFLVEVIELVHRTMTEKWRSEGLLDLQIDQHWNAYVDEHLLPRLFGYELMMAPYAIAHLKIGLTLLATGYEFKGAGRVQVYLTNALEPAEADDGDWHLWSTALADESKAVNAVKRDERFTVVIGNPPYSGVSSNMSDSAQALVDRYRFVQGEPIREKKIWLQDDYVKFHALSQTLIDCGGVVGLITNHGFVDNPTFRGLRASLMESYSTMVVVDLHGNSLKRESTPDGRPDENVFDIQQGVAVFVGASCTGSSGFFRQDLWGTRAEKMQYLHANVPSKSEPVALRPPYFLFAAEDVMSDLYDRWTCLSEIIPIRSSGIITARDSLVMDLETSQIMRRMEDFRQSKLTDAEIRDKYFQGKGSAKYPPGDSRGWKLPDARGALRSDPSWEDRIQAVAYRPFDDRMCFYADYMVDWPRDEITRELVEERNFVVVFPRNTGANRNWSHVFVSRSPVVGRFFPDSACISYMAPVWSLASDGAKQNVVEDFLPWITCEQHCVLPPGIAYVVAILHSSQYRAKYLTNLRLDFPRIPLPPPGLAEQLVGLGELLAKNLLLENPPPTDVLCFGGVCDSMVTDLIWDQGTVYVDKERTRGFRPIPKDAWDFEVGGHQVCAKWLKDRQAKGGKNPRPGRVLTEEDIEHYQKIVAAITETIRIMGEIDEVIDAHGGWPDAFVTEPLADVEPSDDEVSA